MKAFYGSRFSPNMTRTPEGFLICHNVPIARTGMYEYLGKEIGADNRADEVVKVYRSPDEVFSPAAIASFEGKTATDEHPNQLVTADNNNSFDKGDVTNVRRGTGNETDLLLADLVIKDSILISEIEQGKREVSCGYDCAYEDNGDGTYSQKQIRGNHVAIVQAGRAGNRVAIKDSKNNDLGGNKMEKKIALPRKKTLPERFFTALGIKHFATDADPEELMNAIDEMVEGNKESVQSNPAEEKQEPQEKKATDADAEGDIGTRLSKIEELLSKLLADEAGENKADSIDAMINELEKEKPVKDDDQNTEEESQTIPVEEMDEEVFKFDPSPAAEGDKTKKPLPSTDSVAFLKTLRIMKPIIANMKDPAERKAATDSLNAEFLKIKKGNGTNGYANIMNAQKKNAAKAAHDSALDAESKQVQMDKAFQEIRDKYNIQYAKEAK